MAFRTRTIEIDGELFRLRELSGGAVEHAQSIDGEMTQGLTLIALSLLDGETPRYTIDNVAAGLDHLRDQPQRVLQKLTDAVAALNDASLDDARKN